MVTGGCAVWVLLLSALVSPLRACLPGMATFNFGACPTLDAGDNSNLTLYTGRWYAVQGTVRPFLAPTCILVDVTATNSTSAPIQLGYQYTRFGRTKSRDLSLADNVDSSGTYLVQRTGFSALLRPRVLVADGISDDVITVLSCQPAFIGHLLFAQVLSRNTTVSSASDLSAALASLQDRGVNTARLRAVSQSDCPATSSAAATTAAPAVDIP